MTSSELSSWRRMMRRMGLLALRLLFERESDLKPCGNTLFFQAWAYLMVRNSESAHWFLRGGQGG